MIFRKSLISILALSVLSTSYYSTVLAGPTYTPLVNEDYEGFNNGDPLHPTWSDRSYVDSSRPHTGTKSGEIRFKHQGNAFGFANPVYNLPQTVGQGDTIWYRAYFYFPSTTSFSGGDNGGHSGMLKFMELSKTGHKAPRMYIQIPSPYKKNFGDSGFVLPGVSVVSDSMGFCKNLGGSAFTLPRDRWFSLQLAWKLSSTGSGWTRIWSDGKFIGECTTTTPDSSYTVGHWGIGDWINGGGWIQGASTDNFWMDDVVITKQTPNSLDSGGRPYIHPNDFVGGLQSIADPNPPTQVQ